ncbi:hypothetical protein Anas_06964 [Armadillidium nasatum]|uniref:Uncharacterized protein n=1 Tax=Armadillidium nasatum TaxID=96803 RepID=A0A5N5SXU0_9CRUS|nr:hypothetical protein Anas_06964 [Armadillidium nasatum]
MKFSACIYIEVGPVSSFYTLLYEFSASEYKCSEDEESDIFIIIAFGLSRGRLDECAFGSTAADTFGNGALITCLLITPLLLICYLMGRMEIQETILVPKTSIVI